jgi:sugar phosphate isomerase/epimerase
VQINLHHLRSRSVPEIERLRDAGAGLTLLASGDFLGSARAGDGVDVGVERVRGWLERASALGSPILRVASGFYRAELADRPDLIAGEQAFVAEVLDHTADEALASGVRLVLENHSDFTVGEYQAIMRAAGAERTGVFLDLTNAVAALENPVAVVERLAPFAVAGHVKDYELRSLQQPDSYHRRGFEVLYRYPGEGVAPLRELLRVLLSGLQGGEYRLTIEGLDNRAGVDDQRVPLAPALTHLRGLIADVAAVCSISTRQSDRSAFGGTTASLTAIQTQKSRIGMNNTAASWIRPTTIPSHSAATPACEG